MICLVRKIEIADLPEERVRQQLLHRMVEKLGYPLSKIAVEKGLNQILPLHPEEVPDCRVDILVLGDDFHPLLLIECKGVPLSQEALQQVIGYNHYCGAPFFAVANQSEIQMGWWDEQNELKTISFLPPYQQLLGAR